MKDGGRLRGGGETNKRIYITQSAKVINRKEKKKEKEKRKKGACAPLFHWNIKRTRQMRLLVWSVKLCGRETSEYLMAL